MKAFKEMTSVEIKSMSDEEFNAVSPFEKHSCYNCGDLHSYISWWCSNTKAIKIRGTRIPGIIKCPCWTPDWSVIDKKYKTHENGYVTIMENLIEKKNKFIQKLKSLFK